MHKRGQASQSSFPFLWGLGTRPRSLGTGQAAPCAPPRGNPGAAMTPKSWLALGRATSGRRGRPPPRRPEGREIPPAPTCRGSRGTRMGAKGAAHAPRRQQLCCPSASRSGRGSAPHSETGRQRLLPERSWNLNSLPADPLTGLSPEPTSVTDKRCGGTWGFETTGRGDHGGVPHYPRPGSPGRTGTDSHRASCRSTKKYTGGSATVKSPSNLC